MSARAIAIAPEARDGRTLDGEQLFKGRGAAPWLFLSPALAAGLLFYLLPGLFLLWLSLTNWGGLEAPNLIGLRNYVYLLSRDPRFLETLLHTLVFSLGTVTLTIPAALLVAAAARRSRLLAFWRILFCLPMATNVVAVGWIGRYLFDGTHGAVSRLLGTVGIVTPNWVTEPGWAMAAVVIMSAWMLLGQNMLLFLAGLEPIDESFDDAAQLDGASAWQRLWHITLPLIRPTLFLATVTTFLAANSHFALILVMTDGGPLESTQVTPLYMYTAAFEDLRLGRASAMAVLLFAVVMILTFVQLRLLRRGGIEAWGSSR